jgi:serine/threonine protein kinase
VGTIFHGYEIKEKIGSGGMSTVYRGLHGTLGYPVAVKVLHPGLAGDESFIARFEREARAASSLRNNNITRVIDFGSEDDMYFIVMEHIDGPDLQKLFADFQKAVGRSRPLPAEIALLILEEVAYGLKAAHTNGIIHRDMKPNNVLLSNEGEVKIADFGLARDTRAFARLSAQNLTQPGMVVGTPSYMSPEQAAGRDDLDHRTDIFSLGVMAYQLLTGEKPFKGDTPTAVQESIINDAPSPLTHEACPLLTAEISALLDKMLAKDPAKRYQSMDQVLMALKECMESIDRSGALIKYRRDYLARFAKEPVTFAEELRHQNIKSHLNLGYHFKNMGLENIGDAIREFHYVLSLDPQHSKAGEAMRELKRRAEESGQSHAVVAPPARADDEDATGRTLVMPQASAAAMPRAGGKAAPTAGSAAAGSARPWFASRGARRAGVAVLAVAVVAAIVLGSRTRAPAPTVTKPAPTAAAPGTAANPPPVSAAPVAAPPATAPATPPAITAKPVAVPPPVASVAVATPGPRPAAAPGRGHARVVISPFADVYLDGKLIREGAKVAVLEAAAGRHTVSLRHRPSYGRLDLPAFQIVPGETLALGRHSFQATGSLRVAATPAAFVTVDGLDTGQQTPFLLEKLGAGEHTIGVRCPGYDVTGAVSGGGGGALTVTRGAGGEGQVRIRLAEDQEIRIRFELAKP